MKKFISGFLSGTIIAATAGVFAASYVADPASFKVFVNGKEFTSDPPAIVVEGRTYLPLRSIGEALGVPVKWNDELKQAEVGNSAPKAAENQYSRTNPAPINTIQEFSRKTPQNPYINTSSISPDYTATIRVTEVTRGDEALKAIKDYNGYSEDPKEGYEYIMAKVAFSLLTAENDASISASYTNFDFYSSKGEEYASTYVSYDGELSQDIYAGGTAEGYVIGMVKKDDPEPRLAYGLDVFNGTGGVWFALYK